MSALWHVQKRWQAWAVWRVCKDASRAAVAVQETSIRHVKRSRRWFLRGFAFWSIRSSDLLRWICMTGAALRMTWHHFFVAGAILYTHGVEKSQNALVRGRQLCTQLLIFEASLTEVLRFGAVNIHFSKKSQSIASFWACQIRLVKEVSHNWFLSDR